MLFRSHLSHEAPPPLSTVARFEQKGLIAFESLVKLAIALGYAGEIRGLFGEAKFDTIDELDLIRRKKEDKRAYPLKLKNRPRE